MERASARLPRHYAAQTSLMGCVPFSSRIKQKKGREMYFLPESKCRHANPDCPAFRRRIPLRSDQQDVGRAAYSYCSICTRTCVGCGDVCAKLSSCHSLCKQCIFEYVRHAIPAQEVADPLLCPCGSGVSLTVSRSTATEVRKLRQERQDAIRLDAQSSAARFKACVVEAALERVLLLSCPGCGSVFEDYDGCAALRCQQCGQNFCGLCLFGSASSEENHRHVIRCRLNPHAGESYFLSTEEAARSKSALRLCRALDVLSEGSMPFLETAAFVRTLFRRSGDLLFREERTRRVLFLCASACYLLLVAALPRVTMTILLLLSMRSEPLAATWPVRVLCPEHH